MSSLIDTKLYKYNSKNKILEWWVTNLRENEDCTFSFDIKYGQQGGKIITKERRVVNGKNKGKSNETTIQQQTELEIGYLYQKQLDDGYVQNIDDYVEPRRPMLAHKYQDRGKSVDWEKDNYASTKLDGIRCFIFVDNDGNCTFESRTGKEFKYFQHIELEVQSKNITNAILDGELYSENISFKKICSLVNSDDYVPEEDVEIKFYIYDMILNNNLDETFENRYKRYSSIFDTNIENHIISVTQTLVKSEEDMKILAAQFVSENYEGLMLKQGDAKYDFGKRSVALLKYKEMHSAEFKIKDIFVAENDPDRVQIELYINPENTEETFKIGTLKGNKEDNYNNYYCNRDNLINKWLTVNYQTLTSYGVPLFPVGIGIREGEVIDGEFVPES